MTRLEALKDPDRAAEILCVLVLDVMIGMDAENYLCDSCPAERWCDVGHLGFIDWLQTEDDLSIGYRRRI